MTRNIPKIALTGGLRAGKSTVATSLAIDYGFNRVSFGSALNRVIKELFADSPLYPEEVIEVGSPCPFTGKRDTVVRRNRKLQQTVGQTMRTIDPDVWVRQAAKTVEMYESFYDCPGIVIDDLRQANEYEWAKANGFVVVRVNADEDERLKRANELADAYSVEDLRHETEVSASKLDADYEIDNGDGVTMEELERQIGEIVADIRKGSD